VKRHKAKVYTVIVAKVFNVFFNTYWWHFYFQS